MKTSLYAVLAAAVLGGATAALAATSGAVKADAQVHYLEPENFTDFRLSPMGGKSDQDLLESELTKRVQELAAMYLPAGSHLTLRFRDIDMAGDYEPFRGPRWDDVRILRSVYPPRMHLEFSVTDAAGNVLASGERKLADLTYQWNLRLPTRSSSTDIEQDMLRDFVSDLGRSLRG